MVRPERRRPADLVAAAALTVAVVVAAVLFFRTSDAATTVAQPAAAPPPAAPTEPAVLPPSLAPAWEAPSAATPVPVVLSGTVVTGSGDAAGSDVLGRDLLSGAVRWRYHRVEPLCTVGVGFGDAIAVYRRGNYCSEVTALQPATGARGPQRNADVRPGTRLLAEPGHVTATGTDYLEVWRSDLVATLEYGAYPTPAQPGRQPRTGCGYGSVAVAAGRVGVLERCPGDPGDRLTVLRADGPGADQPQEEFSTVLDGRGARLVALSADREAVLLPDPARLEVLDNTGAHPVSFPLGLPAADTVGDPPGGVPPVRSEPAALSWWTGSSTVALDPVDLHPLWTLPQTLGPGTLLAGRLLVPVPGGLAVLDPTTGVRSGLLALDRGGYTGPIEPATAGPVVLEQRGSTLVALR